MLNLKLRFLLLFSSFFIMGAYARETQAIKMGPIHEAFVTKESGNIILEAVALQPPNDIQENSPKQTDPQAEWIPGYWAWLKERDDFIWVSGIWRRSPLGMKWVSGMWRQFDEGWVWLHGFWSVVSANALSYISEAPPATIDEKIPPEPGKQYFWIPGYWNWDTIKYKYIWYSGRWEKFDPKWVYVPPHYEWRGGGYVSIPAYWDWPLEKRGAVYAALYIEPGLREQFDYSPQNILSPATIVEILYPWWPDYQCFFHHHYFYHMDLWNAWGVIPPWWAWNTWWGFSSHDQWQLWWWWTHPGFPHPSWLTQEVADQIPPPTDFILKLMGAITPPPTVTFDGIITNEALLRGIREVTGESDGPILPTDPKQIQEIQVVAQPIETPNLPYLRPTGTGAESPQKPVIGPSTDSLPAPPQREKPPAKPVLPENATKEPRPETPSFQHVQPKQFRPSFSYQNRGQRRSKRLGPQPTAPEYKPLPGIAPPFVQQSNTQYSNPVNPTVNPKQNQNQVNQRTVSPPSTQVPSSQLQNLPKAPSYQVPSQGTLQIFPQQNPFTQQNYPQHISPFQYQNNIRPASPQQRIPVRPPYSSSPIDPLYHYQGAQPVEDWPPIPFSLQNRGYLMNNPQPQRNPPIPRAYDHEGRFEPY